MGRELAILALAALALPGSAQAQALGARERALHLLSRFSFGPTRAELARVLELGEEAWLDEQLAALEDPALAARLEAFPTLGLPAVDVWALTYEATPDDASPEERRRIREKNDAPRRELMAATATRAVYARAQLVEVLVDFWRNHFNVSYTKEGPALQLLTEWDERVLRAHALAPFGELLAATAHAPAMLHYLDNSSSRRPSTGAELAELERRIRRATGSRAAGERAADLALQRGLNENYARELLELHTLGADNGYRQQDVVALAEVLTGWTWERTDTGWGFRFRGDLHVTGSKRFLGQRIQGEIEKGEAEGQAVLALLAEERGTSEFLALKLARHFVDDDPPPRLVADLAAAFRKHDGRPAEVLRALVAHDAFWSRAHYRSKFKTPQEFVFSALRATGAEVDDWSEVLRRLGDMGQPIYHCDDPTGWYDTAEAWLDPGVLALRWEFASDLAHDRVAGVRLGGAVFAEVGDEVPVHAWSTRLTARLLPGGAGLATQVALDRAAAQSFAQDAQPDALRRRLLALLLGSPDFQRQ